jgi:hypothetical protein
MMCTYSVVYKLYSPRLSRPSPRQKEGWILSTHLSTFATSLVASKKTMKKVARGATSPNTQLMNSVVVMALQPRCSGGGGKEQQCFQCFISSCFKSSILVVFISIYMYNSCIYLHPRTTGATWDTRDSHQCVSNYTVCLCTALCALYNACVCPRQHTDVIRTTTLYGYFRSS